MKKVKAMAVATLLSMPALTGCTYTTSTPPGAKAAAGPASAGSQTPAAQDHAAPASSAPGVDPEPTVATPSQPPKVASDLPTTAPSTGDDPVGADSPGSDAPPVGTAAVVTGGDLLLGKPARFDDGLDGSFEVTVDSIQYGDSVKELGWPLESRTGKFVFARVTWKATLGSSIPSPFNFRCVDAAGADCQTVFTTRQSLISDTIKQGQSLTGYVVFEAPKGELSLTFQPIMGDAKAKIQFRPAP